MQNLVSLSTQTITLQRNEILTSQGDIDHNCYYIQSGSLRVFIIDDEGEEQIIRFGYKDNIIVALDSYITNKPTNFYIQAIKKSTLKIITKKQINAYLKVEGNQDLWNKILENLIIQQMEREVDLLTNSPKKRYERVLKRSPQLFQEIPNKHIANYLKMTPETLSRLKK